MLVGTGMRRGTSFPHLLVIIVADVGQQEAQAQTLVIMGATTGGSGGWGSGPPKNLDGPPTFYIAFY